MMSYAIIERIIKSPVTGDTLSHKSDLVIYDRPYGEDFYNAILGEHDVLVYFGLIDNISISASFSSQN